ncbi:type II secretion system protein GspF [Bacteriovorax stolpii]|uniref:Type II secretion system protein GspF n=1 Tax=Bacteriovorax stolpii TaxID=960 RepID=A0A2K9NR09_BACTC|nr:type II secretion system inner membrane protein GspF [Bacteriovorax stolpii]AUN97966.1 type II secretion system protein GspF [Bacteriovorax stolpii]QDK42048.1 type II secretion system protein GspF [Bacteriovorax stolpii]TDP51799.1 type II secretion system protein F (GspF) [Bacteriovorax stolpii]
MAIYNYKGIDKSGSEVKGTVNVEGLSAAKTRIRGMGIMLIEISEQTSGTVKKSGGINFGSAVSINDLALMTRQLATLLRAKIQVVEAFSALVDQTENPNLKITLSEIRQKVNEGSSLAKALSDYPKIFDNVYVNMVDAGEASGTLEVVLLKLADFTEGQVKLRNKVKGAMTYPMIMMGAGGAMIGIIFIFVIPKLTRIFVSMKKELPLQTKICIWISNFLMNYWWLVILGLVGGWMLFKRYISTESGRSKYDALVLKLPVVGEIVTMVNVSRFCSTLATLLQSGVPILVSMKIVSNLISNVHMKKAIEDSRSSVSEGASLTGPLVRSELFPPMVTHMIKLGEKSGELEPMLQIVSENYEDQVNSKLAGLTSILEPIMMVAMGLVVAFIIFSVVVPLIDLNSVGR